MCLYLENLFHRVLSYPVVGDQEVTHCVALTLLLPFNLDGDVPIDHHSITGPVLSTLFLKGNNGDGQITTLNDMLRL